MNPMSQDRYGPVIVLSSNYPCASQKKLFTVWDKLRNKN